jgi:hypothetical protein
MKVSPELLSEAAGVVLSLLFSYIPGLKAKFDPLDNVWKQLIMAGTLLVVAAAAFGLACGGIYDLVTCDQAGVVMLVESWVLALMANQATYLLTKPDKE